MILFTAVIIGDIMKQISTLLLLLLSNICIAQVNVETLTDVPAKFKAKYYSQRREYNPLQVGNTWQYYYADNNGYWTTTVVKDSIINGKQYFKKINYEVDPPKRNFISWERNDSTRSGVTFMLDFQDVNKNGNYSEELPIDSLENPYWSRYATYKYSFNVPFFFSGEKTVLVGDTSWVKLDGDTVISRYFQIEELFWGEEIVENFGILYNWSESPIRGCTGAIVNGKKYGTLVSVDEKDIESIPTEFILSQNYPNPFNPSTTINFTISRNKQGSSCTNVKLIVFDNLGRKVTTLVDEQKTAGSYSVTFNAQGLSSGVYYYSLITGNKILTKSMILIK
jgi:hypothetical protein